MTSREALTLDSGHQELQRGGPFPAPALAQLLLPQLPGTSAGPHCVTPGTHSFVGCLPSSCSGFELRVMIYTGHQGIPPPCGLLVLSQTHRQTFAGVVMRAAKGQGTKMRHPGRVAGRAEKASQRTCPLSWVLRQEEMGHGGEEGPAALQRLRSKEATTLSLHPVTCSPTHYSLFSGLRAVVSDMALT